MPDLIRPRDSFVYKTDRPWPNPSLTIAAIVGHTTPTTVRLWLRTGRTGQLSLFLYPQAEISDAAARADFRERLSRVPLALDEAQRLLPGTRREDFAIESLDSDTTTVLDLADLLPNTRYGYFLLEMWDFLGTSLRRHGDEIDLVIAGGQPVLHRRRSDAGHLALSESQNAQSAGDSTSG